MIRPICMSARGSQRSSARASRAAGGPACWAPGSQGPRVSSGLGRSRSPIGLIEGLRRPASRRYLPRLMQGRDLPGPRRGARRGAPGAGAARRRRRHRPRGGHRRLRLRPPPLPRPSRDRARLHARARVRRHGRRRRRRRDPVAEGDRVLGCFCSACGKCFFCRRGDFHKCDEGRVFGHGKTLGSLQGAQAERVLVPHADLTLRKVPEGMSDDSALFAGDVMGTGWHAVDQAGIRPGDSAAVLGLGPVGLCAVQAAKAAGAAKVIAIDSVEDRLAMARAVRCAGRPSDRGRPACRRQAGHRGARRGRRDRRRRPPRCPRAGRAA